MSNWAQRGKAAINSVELKEVGGSADRISTFYNHLPKDGVRKVLKENQKYLEEGQEINGIYLGNSEQTGKYGISVLHKIKTNEGQVISIPGSKPGTGQVNKRLSQVENGSQVYFQYTGKKEMTDGDFTGNLSHTCIVRAEKLKT